MTAFRHCQALTDFPHCIDITNGFIFFLTYFHIALLTSHVFSSDTFVDTYCFVIKILFAISVD